MVDLRKPIAVLGITNNCGIGILDINEEQVVIRGVSDDTHTLKLYSTDKGIYFLYGGHRYYTNEFMRVGGRQ